MPIIITYELYSFWQYFSRAKNCYMQAEGVQPPSLISPLGSGTHCTRTFHQGSRLASAHPSIYKVELKANSADKKHPPYMLD